MIQKEVIDFLKDVSANNNRDWFMANKHRHDSARENVIAFTADIIKLLSKADAGVSPDTDAKKSVLRIYRDVRFSRDKTPYKKNFGINIVRQGKKGSRGPEYYIHIEPGGAFVAGGYWQPDAADLKAIRQEIDYNAADLKNIIDNPAFVKLFGDFKQQEKLKTLPRDYTADNPNIELLKLKSFTAVHYLKDKDLLQKDAVQNIVSICAAMYPLNVFLDNAIA